MKITKFEFTDKDGNTLFGYKSEELLEQGYIYAPWISVNVATIVNGRMVWHRSRWMRLWIWIKDRFRKKQVFTDRVLTKYSKKSVNPSYYSKIMVDNLKTNEK